MNDRNPVKNEAAFIDEYIAFLGQYKPDSITLLDNLHDGVILVDMEGIIVEWNSQMEYFTGIRSDHAMDCALWSIGLRFTHTEEKNMLLNRAIKEELINFFISAENPWLGKVQYFIILHVNGISWNVQCLRLLLRTKYGFRLAFIIRNVTKQEQLDRNIKYLETHDCMSGLLNRIGFEQEMIRLEHISCNPLSILVCDIDGLKSFNDYPGYDTGTQLINMMSGIIKSSLHDNDAGAYIGGGEFVVFLPHKDANSAKNINIFLRAALADINSSDSNICFNSSIGWAFRNDLSKSVRELFLEAENKMYQQKLYSSQSYRSRIVRMLRNILEQRDLITLRHADRLENIMGIFAQSLDLSEQKTVELRLLARFHDIGKVCISDSILFKPGRLNSDEALQMMKHSKMGYDITLMFPELTSIAPWVLHHHEWWNGDGYPYGLQGKQIPLESRLLALADAFDAMIDQRPYKKPISKDAARLEIIKCSETQFDPELVPLFVNIIKDIPN